MLHKIGEALNLRAVEFMGRSRQVGGCAHAIRQSDQRDIVARKARAAVTDRALQVFAPDAGIQANSPCNHVHTRTWNFLTQSGQHVRKAYLRGDVSVHREFGDLRVHQIHAGNGGAVLAHALIQGLQQCARPRVGFSDQQEIGIQEIADHASKRDKFRAVAQAEIGSGALMADFLQGVADLTAGRPRHHRTRQSNEVIFPLCGKRAANGFADRENVAQ